MNRLPVQFDLLPIQLTPLLSGAVFFRHTVSELEFPRTAAASERDCGAISADTASRPARHFGTAPEFCVNLQSAYDLGMAKATLADRVNAEVSPRAA